jgi:hypothetical protein
MNLGLRLGLRLGFALDFAILQLLHRLYLAAVLAFDYDERN